MSGELWPAEDLSSSGASEYLCDRYDQRRTCMSGEDGFKRICCALFSLLDCRRAELPGILERWPTESQWTRAGRPEESPRGRQA